MNCGKVAKHIHDYFENRLEAAQAEALERHLATCRNCRALLAELNSQDRILKAALAAPRPSAGFQERLQAALTAEQAFVASRRSARRLLLPQPALALYAACAAVFLVAVLLYWRSASPSESGASASVAIVGRPVEPGPFDAEPPAWWQSFTATRGGLVRYSGRTSIRYRLVGPDVYELTVDAFPVASIEL